MMQKPQQSKQVSTQAARGFDLEAFWAEEDRPPPPAVSAHFVSPAPQRKPLQVQVLPPEPAPLVQPAGSVASRVQGSYMDRARGFNLVALPLAGAMGVGSLILGLVGFSVPILSVAALAWLWTGFLLTWLAAWAFHLLFSADGISLLHTLRLWRYLEREQAERWRFYERQFDREDR